MAFVYGNSAGPGPSYYRAVIDQSWQDQGDGYYKCCANIRVQVLSGSNFYGTYLKTTWGSEGTLYGPGDSYCFKDLGCKSVPYGGSWTIEGSATYNNHKSTVRHTFAPPKPTYKVNYNANGGYGAPAAQTKTWGTNLTLSGAKPARDGHSFVNWNTRQDGGGTPYNPGSTYTSNSGVTLYAQWSIYKYTITYDANGGWNAPAAQTKNWGSAITLSHSHPTRTNYNFKGWGTSPNASSPAYWAGSSYTANASITLYAIWELAYTQPRIWGVSADRCDSSGTYNEEGTYARVKCSWQTDHTISKVVLWWKKDTDKQWSSMNVPNMSGTSGSVDSIIGNGSFSTEYTYNICIEVNDNTGKTERYTDIAPLAYIMDVLSSGNGIAFGKPATRPNFIDTSWKIKGIGHGSAWVYGRENAMISQSTLSESGYCCFASVKTKNGTWDIGAYDNAGFSDQLVFSFIKDSDYKTGNNSTGAQVEIYSDGRIHTSYGGGQYLVSENMLANYVPKSMLADYVVSHGNNGQWAYRKWNSGYMEAWRSTDASITVDITSPFYNWYYGYAEMKTSGISIKTIENVHISTRSGTELLFASLTNVTVLSDGNAQINFYVTNAREIRGKSVNLEISIKGRWK